MSILHVLKAMAPGTKILVSDESLLKESGQVNLYDLGFMDPQEVTIFDKSLVEKRKGFILSKGNFLQYKWVRNPNKFLNMLDYSERMFFTEGKTDVSAYGRGIVTTMLRQGSNISRLMYIIVVNTPQHSTQNSAFRAYETKQLRGEIDD